MNVKLYDSELKVMEVFWQEGDIQATKVCSILNGSIGWNPNTTYTIIKKCISKGYLSRQNPGFWCHALVSKEEIQREEIQNMIQRLFGGSAINFMNTLLKDPNLFSDQELDEMKELLNK